MAFSRADTRPTSDDVLAAPGGPAAAGTNAGLGPALVVVVALAVAGFAALMSLALLRVHPDSILAIRFGADQNQNAKTALYLGAFAVLLPAALLVGHRVADAIAAGPNGRALGGLSAVLAATLAGILIILKVSNDLPWGDGLRGLFAAMALWSVTAVAVLARAARPRAWAPLRALEGRGEVLGVAAGVMAFVAVLGFTHLSGLDIVALVVGVGVIGAAVARLGSRELPHLRRPWGPAVDALVIVLIILAIPDLVVFTTSSALPNVFTRPGIIQFHHDFLLGPTNQVLRGGTLLVDSPVSQYGVGSVYFLAAWFHLAPIGYGTYGLLDGILTGVFFAAGYSVLRLAGAPRLLAVPALAVGVVTLVYALHYPIGGLPQQGPLRFGLPMALILATVAAVRWPHRARLADAAALVVVGVSSIWAVEAFAYTSLTLLALILVRATFQPAGARRAWVLRQGALVVVACVSAHVILAAATLAATGSLPHWGQYFAYLRAFLGGGKAGELTYDFQPWSPALPVGVGYAASAVAVALVVRRRPASVARHAALIVALAGTTAYGIALLSYTQNRSSTYLLPYVALPALLAGVLWLTLVLRSPEIAPRTLRRGSLAFVLSVGLVMLLSALPVGDRFSRSALAHAYPGSGLDAAVSRLWHPPPIDPRAPAGERLLDRYMPGQRHVLVLLPKSPELAVEILMRSERANRLPIGNPVEESFVPSVWVAPLRRAIGRLQPGDRVLIDTTTLTVLAALRARPGFDPLADPQIGSDPLEEWILLEIARRFEFRPVGRGGAGFIVEELVRR
ncbi:MAG: hypothetical protein QOH43_2283 [Solirubrobacteraceae bacterium]|jgi:hypothetical protein|nr:hypothetical protein [Solirubrobacteraceae bacterium]